jgi:hypothetical protein
VAKPTTDQELSETIADLGDALANAYLVTDHDGRTFVDRINLSRAGQPVAASYTGSGSSSDVADPTYAAILMDASGRLLSDPAERDAEELHRAIVRAAQAMTVATDVAARYLVRPASSVEQRATDLVETNSDDGCESCSRIVRGGERRRTPTYRTSTIGDRLASTTRLCRWCYDYVMRQPPNAQLVLVRAIPRRELREHWQRIDKDEQRPRSHRVPVA